jgi:hypothetical protein
VYNHQKECQYGMLVLWEKTRFAPPLLLISGATAYLKKISEIFIKNYQSIINHCLPVRRPVEVDIIISHSTIVVDDNIHCSRVINLNFLNLFRVDLVPVKPFKKNILMAQLRWHVAIATKSAVCRAV